MNFPLDQDLTDWLLEHYGPEKVKVDPGLSRMRNALSHLLPELSKIPVITIAGTNGKGETTLWLSQFLSHKKRCVWMSPHIERITERFSSEEGEIDQSFLRDLISRCHAYVQEEKHALSFYEFLFLVFCTWAHEKKPEVILLEVGLGGRLDAVNVFDAQIVLLPSISRDHQEYLGSRYDQILGEKLGLLRKDNVLLSYLSPRYLREKTGFICQKRGSFWFDLEELGLYPSFDFSHRNQLLAYAASKLFEKTPLDRLKKRDFYSEWKPSAESFEHRGECIQAGAEYIFFGSHNVDGMRKLIQFLHSDNYNFGRPSFDAVIAAFSKRDETDLRVLLKMLKSSHLGPVTVTTFNHPKSANLVIEKLAIQEGLNFVQDIDGFRQELERKKDNRPRVLVTGSYYFIGQFKSLIS